MHIVAEVDFNWTIPEIANRAVKAVSFASIGGGGDGVESGYWRLDIFYRI